MWRRRGFRRTESKSCAKRSKATLEDPEFKAEAKKSKLVMEYVSADEINGLVKDILNISPKAKKGLQFLVRKQTN